MRWKKLSQTKDLISFEKKKKDCNVRVEGSADREGKWKVYKVYYNGKGFNFVEEYKAENKEHAISLVNRLRKKKDLTIKEIKQLQSQNKEIFVDFKRIYREESIEKWNFSLDKEIKHNFVLIKFGGKIKADLVMHEKYMVIEEQVIKKITDFFSLNEEDEIEWNIYYFAYRKTNDIKHKKDIGVKGTVVIGKIDFEASEDD